MVLIYSSFLLSRAVFPVLKLTVSGERGQRVEGLLERIAFYPAVKLAFPRKKEQPLTLVWSQAAEDWRMNPAT
jgi:hypothetical protein